MPCPPVPVGYLPLWWKHGVLDVPVCLEVWGRGGSLQLLSIGGGGGANIYYYIQGKECM